jgi:hypothetical protein
MNKIFISGSISIKNINGPIVSCLENIVQKGHEIFIGDADGVDKAVQTFLSGRDYKNVVVYCSGEFCRNNIGKWKEEHVFVPPKAKGRRFYMLKDDQMAIDADYGFLIWDGKSAGTINNLSNLIRLGKKGKVYLIPSHNFFAIKDKHSFEELLIKCNPDDINKIDKKIGFRNKLGEQDVPLQQQLGFEMPQEKVLIDNSETVDQYATTVKENASDSYGYSKERRSIIDFLRNNFLKDLRKMVEMGMDYYAFNLICSGLELLGSFFDQKQLSEGGMSKARIDNAIDNLFSKEYSATNIKHAITQQIRNSLLHQFKPTGNIALTSETNSHCPRKYHLKKPYDLIDNRIIVVIETFIDDFENAIDKLINEKNGKLKSSINASRFQYEFLCIDTVNIENNEITLSADVPYTEIESKSL